MRPEFAQFDPPELRISPLLTVEQLAEWLQISPKTIYQWRARRPEPYGPPAIKVGKYLRWKQETVEAWIEAHRNGD